ncbi:hypothetical protein [Aliagarivorans marinus]|uniref:hypothetical protein n=1 Tax=Aliagarivorans marinus TaxID=561965 RepID=UPI000405BFA5|nr:hypothetical protein [Aliagarivorans marinus]
MKLIAYLPVIWLSLSGLLLSGCSHTPNDVYTEGEPLRREHLLAEGAHFNGSTLSSYPDISAYKVKKLDAFLLTQLQLRYGQSVQADTSTAGSPRFVISYHIESDQITKNHHQHKQSECFSAHREMNVRLEVLDSQSHELAWSGNLARGLSNQNCIRPSGGETGLLGGLAQSLGWAGEDKVSQASAKYPSPPSSQRVGEWVLSGLSSSLP